jgi:hypothetical protein
MGLVQPSGARVGATDGLGAGWRRVYSSRPLAVSRPRSEYCVSTVGLDEQVIRAYIRHQEQEEKLQEELQRQGL